MTQEQAKQADKVAALMIYRGGLPLSFFEDEAVTDFLTYLNPTYKPPSRYQLSRGLLEDAYDTVKARVDAAIDNEQDLNIQFDESKDSAHNRVMNIAVGTAQGAFYYHNLDMGATTLSAQTMAAKIEEECVKISKGQLNRVNSIAGDTCDGNLSTFRLLQTVPSLSHCFFIPCDAHSLQLLVKDICTHDTVKQVVSAADKVVSHFKHSPKQYQIFKAIQAQIIEIPLALTMASNTRWGTHAKEFQRLIHNEQALRRYGVDSQVDLTTSEQAKSVHATLTHPHFFSDLRALNDLIEPIVELQNRAQSDAAHLGYVKERWLTIWQHFHQQQALVPHLFIDLWPKLEARLNRQLFDLHTLAFWLVPGNAQAQRFQQNEQTKLVNCLKRFVKPEQYVETVQSFLDYYNRRGDHKDSISWEFTGKTDAAKTFWSFHLDSTPVLAQLALRILNTIANSVPCERHFSAMNWIHTPTRSRLTTDRVNKLLFVQLNLRVLNRAREK